MLSRDLTVRLAALERASATRAQLVVVQWAPAAEGGLRMLAHIDGRPVWQRLGEAEDSFELRLRQEVGDLPETLWVWIRHFGQEQLSTQKLMGTLE